MAAGPSLSGDMSRKSVVAGQCGLPSPRRSAMKARPFLQLEDRGHASHPIGSASNSSGLVSILVRGSTTAAAREE
jgi:hypothetical protein